MSLADWINGTAGTVAEVASVAVARPQTLKTVFSDLGAGRHPDNPFGAGRKKAGIELLESATATHATPATHAPAELPADLAEAATRCCAELHRDGPEGVAAMLDDLRHFPPASWPWLVDHFNRQLPDPVANGFRAATPTICCGNCQHGTATDHPAILTCDLGIPSGLPIRGRWSTDRHGCGQFAALVRPLD